MCHHFWGYSLYNVELCEWSPEGWGCLQEQWLASWFWLGHLAGQLTCSFAQHLSGQTKTTRVKERTAQSRGTEMEWPLSYTQVFEFPKGQWGVPGAWSLCQKPQKEALWFLLGIAAGMFGRNSAGSALMPACRDPSSPKNRDRQPGKMPIELGLEKGKWKKLFSGWSVCPRADHEDLQLLQQGQGEERNLPFPSSDPCSHKP